MNGPILPIKNSLRQIQIYWCKDCARHFSFLVDIVQLRNGLIHLLDYKPKAREIDAVNQLVIYALAFASRARLPVKAFKCAWFDDKEFFEFFPLQAVRAKT